MLELRICLESEAAGLAAMRRTPSEIDEIGRAFENFRAGTKRAGFAADADFKFHLSICEATHNRYFIDVLLHFGPLIIPKASLKEIKPDGNGRFEEVERVCNEHEDIFNAIARQDTDGARIAMRAHLNNSRERLRRCS